MSAGDVTSAKLADRFQGAKWAIEAGVAAVPGTGAPAQGTSGVAQADIQTVGAGAAELIMAETTKLAEAVSMLR